MHLAVWSKRGRFTTPPKKSPIPRHLCVYGLSAAGKTTHAKLLAQQLEMDYVSASQLMFDEIGYKDPGQQDTWTVHSPELSHARESGLVDEAVNQQLMERAESSLPAVFDSWTLPYIARSSDFLRKTVFFLQLESDLSSRALRCLVSHGPNAIYSITEAADLIRDKDTFSRQRFKNLFGFDILSRATGLKDARKARIDISRYVFGSSPHQIRRGIQSAHNTILAVLPHRSEYISNLGADSASLRRNNLQR
jgi:cytidylate kinase